MTLLTLPLMKFYLNPQQFLIQIMISKTKIIYSLLTTGFIAATNAADIEMNLNSSSTFPGNLSETSAYLENGAPYTGAIDSSTNITLNAQFDSVPGNDIASVSSNITAGDFTYNMNLPKSFWGKTMLSLSENYTFSVDNFYFNIIESATTHPILTFYMNSGSNLKVRGDFLYTDSRSLKDWYQTRLTLSGSGSFNVDGNMTIDSKPTAALSNNLDAVFLELNVTNFNVGGALTLQNIRGDENIIMITGTANTSYSRSFGGLRVSQNGMIIMRGTPTAPITTNIFLTNTTVSEYIGGLLSREVEGVVADNKLNISMTANSPSGRQIMRFNSTNNWTMDNVTYLDSPNSLGEVEVSNGRLDIGMYDGMKGGKLMLNGYNGASNAIFSATGILSGTENGKVVFDSMEFSRGTIVFDLAEEKEFGDFIQINGAATRTSDTAELIFDINISAYDLESWLSASQEDEWNVDLMSFSTSESNLTADDITLKLQDGVFGKLSITDLDGISTITASLTTVPEPAEIAALFGLAALFFAWRKRSKK